MPVWVAAVLWAAATAPWCGRALAADAAGPAATESAAAPAAGADAASAAPEAAGAGKAEEDPVLVRVNGDPILTSEFNARIVLRLPATGSHGELSPERVARYQRELLQEMVFFRLMLQDARKKGIRATDAEIDQEEKALRDRFRDEASYLKAVAARGLDVERIREGLGDYVLVRKVEEQVEGSVPPPTQAQLREYYAANPDKFRIPPQAEVRYLLVEVEASSPQDVWEAAREQVAAIRQRVTDGEPLDVVWQEAATRKGVRAEDLGLIHEGQADLDEVGKAAFALKPGEISEPVFTLFGYALVHVTRRVEGRLMAFDGLKLELFASEWLAARRMEARDAWLKGLMGGAKLEFPE
ncbi:MAG: peptidyl-prolyl cis-trans isomerase [Nitrospirota bacterium]|nr:peptidyl-prolyl cis-trans isomerase [Nitrospirota bacterium]